MSALKKAPTQNNLMRLLRLQIKSGYLQHIPSEYDYMRRYLPLSYGTRVEPTVILKTPYINLYKKALSKNPKFAAERVYGAFAHEEPLALTLAKRQFELMSKGVREEAAYTQALNFVHEKENEAYVKTKAFVEELKTIVGDSEAALSLDEETATELFHWQDFMSTRMYDYLPLAEQAELDMFVQKKILKWNEVERERRMQDIAFYHQFKETLELLFPKTEEVKAMETTLFKKQARDRLLSVHDVHSHLCQGEKPFFVEEYLELFDMVSANPILYDWSPENSERLTNFIVQSLAFKDQLYGHSNEYTTNYLDLVRNCFFPQIRFPELATTLKTPTMEEVKAALFENKIGYVKDAQNGKLYVRRYYRLPLLLFPTEAFCANMGKCLVTLEKLQKSDNALLKKMAEYGVPETDLELVKSRLNSYVSDHLAKHKSVVSNDGNVKKLRRKDLDAILGMDEEDAVVENEVDSLLVAQKLARAEKMANATGGTVGPQLVVGSDEWKEVAAKHGVLPKTPLEEDRLKLMSPTLYSLDVLTSEKQVEAFKVEYDQSDMVLRAKLSRKFHKKETRRMAEKMDAKQVWMEELPDADLFFGKN